MAISLKNKKPGSHTARMCPRLLCFALRSLFGESPSKTPSYCIEACIRHRGDEAKSCPETFSRLMAGMAFGTKKASTSHSPCDEPAMSTSGRYTPQGVPTERPPTSGWTLVDLRELVNIFPKKIKSGMARIHFKNFLMLSREQNRHECVNNIIFQYII